MQNILYKLNIYIQLRKILHNIIVRFYTNLLRHTGLIFTIKYINAPTSIDSNIKVYYNNII